MGAGGVGDGQTGVAGNPRVMGKGLAKILKSSDQ